MPLSRVSREFLGNRRQERIVEVRTKLDATMVRQLAFWFSGIRSLEHRDEAFKNLVAFQQECEQLPNATAIAQTAKVMKRRRRGLHLAASNDVAPASAGPSTTRNLSIVVRNAPKQVEAAIDDSPEAA